MPKKRKAKRSFVGPSRRKRKKQSLLLDPNNKGKPLSKLSPEDFSQAAD